MSNDSDDISYREYRNEIESIAENIEDTWENYPEDYSDVNTIIWEEVDSHRWIIYYSHNLDVLKNSDEGPDEWEVYAEGKDQWREVIQVMAYKAMENDVWEELHRRGNIDF